MTWLFRKLSTKCARVGCPNDPGEEHCLCDTCAEDHRKRNRVSRVRRYWYRKIQLRLW